MTFRTVSHCASTQASPQQSFSSHFKLEMKAYNIHRDLVGCFIDSTIRPGALRLARFLAADPIIGDVSVLCGLSVDVELISSKVRSAVLNWLQEMVLDDYTCSLVTRSFNEIRLDYIERTSKNRARSKYHHFVSDCGVPLPFFKKFLQSCLVQSGFGFSYLTDETARRVDICHVKTEVAQFYLNKLIEDASAFSWNLESVLRVKTFPPKGFVYREQLAISAPKSTTSRGTKCTSREILL